MTKMVLVMILAFLIVWSPYAVAVIFAVSKVNISKKRGGT